MNQRQWLMDRRPYYSVYPGIIPMLLGLDLSKVPSKTICSPLRSLCIRLPKARLPSLLAGTRLNTIMVGTVDGRHLYFEFDCGDVAHSGRQFTQFFMWPREDGTDVETAIEKSFAGGASNYSLGFATAVARLVCGICLLGKDPDLIQPEPLSKEREEFEKTKDPAMIKKAHQRGKVGWSVGRTIETLPHYRRPHLSVRWKRETPIPTPLVPRVVAVKGSIVKRAVVEKVPTGHMDSLSLAT